MRAVKEISFCVKLYNVVSGVVLYLKVDSVLMLKNKY